MRQSLVVIALVISAATGASGGQVSPPLIAPGQPTPGQPTPGQATPARATPARDPVKGTAMLRGQVVDAVTGAAVRRARVTAFGTSTSAAGPRNLFTTFATTDGDGHFEIRELHGGRYNLTASRPGYISMQYGQRPVGQPGTRIDVLDGQRIEKIVIGLARGGVIIGRVLDDFGDPVPGTDVRAMRYRYQNGRRQLTQASSTMGSGASARTDDLGAFRLYALEPGEYYVTAVPSGGFSVMPPGEPQTQGVVQTYFPGTASPQEATRITVQAGRETQGVVFSLSSTRLARIRGRALKLSGEPFAGAFVNLSYREGSNYGSHGGGPVRPDGSFEITGVAPGTYLLSVQQNQGFGDRDRGDQEIGREMVTVNGEDISDVLVVGSRGGIARGRIITDTGVPMSVPARNFGISAQSADPDQPFMSRPMVRVNDDFSFEITNLFDAVRLQPMLMGPVATFGNPNERGWNVKAVLLEGQDVTDRGILFRPGQIVEGVEIVYTQKVTNLSGQLLDDRGAPAHGTVIAFPADERLWLPQSRFIRSARPAPDGQFRFFNATPLDDYLIVGVAQVEDGQWFDPEYLRTLKDVASRLSLGEGETKVQDVKLVKLP